MIEALPPSSDVKKPLGDLGTRAASGVVMIAVALLTAKAGGVLFFMLWLFASIVVFWEWLRLPTGTVSAFAILLGAASLLLVGLLARHDSGEAIVALIAATAVQAALSDRSTRRWASAGQFYAGALLVSVIALRFSPTFGARSIFWLFSTVWATDVFAYFGGRLIGGPKIAPLISPSKTWSGTISGVAAGGLIGTVVAAHDLSVSASTLPIFGLSVLTAALSQGGDAFESSLKRRFGVKDSGNLIPGHGGFMDRLDGFIAAAAFAFLIGYLRSRYLPSIADGLFHWA